MHSGMYLPLCARWWVSCVHQSLCACWWVPWVPTPCVHVGWVVGASFSQLANVFPFLFFANRLVSVLSIPTYDFVVFVVGEFTALIGEE